MNKKLLFSIIGTLVLAAGVIAGIVLVQRNQELREKAAPATSLSITPATQSLQAGADFSYNVRMDTGSNFVTGIDLEINFNPAVFQVTQIQPTSSISSFTSNEIANNIDATAGKIRYAAFTLDKTKAVNGAVNVLTITGKILDDAAAGQYQLAFGSATSVAATQEGQNVLVSKTGANVTVQPGLPRPTATATSQATATATANATATATSSSAPSATATATSTSQANNDEDEDEDEDTDEDEDGVGGGSNEEDPTLPPDVPETGVSLPFAGGIGLGVLAILFSLFLVF